MNQVRNVESVPAGPGQFNTTHWSVVLGAAEGGSPQADQALAQLCEVYWYPLYAYVRRQGYDVDEARDLTQEFFARLLKGNLLRSVDPKKGKFRSFLLAAMEHFLAKQWRDARRLKRGGGQHVLSLDEENAEARYQLEPVDNLTAERLYERRWALILIETAFQRLREEFRASDKQPLFEALQPFLTGDRPDSTYAEVGVVLDRTAGAVKVAVHRLRARYGELIREEVAKTVATPGEVDEELRHLLRIVGD